MQVKVKRKEIITDGELQHAKYIKKDRVNGKWRYYYDYNDGTGYSNRGGKDTKQWSNKAGVEVQKTKDGTNVSLFNTKNTKYWDKHQKTSKKNYGPVTVNKAEDGISYNVTIPNKKKIESMTKKTVKQAKKQIKKGKKYLSKMFK